VPPGDGPSLTCTSALKSLYVISGEVELLIDGETLLVDPEDAVCVPAALSTASITPASVHR
jgi:hypothetical protein